MAWSVPVAPDAALRAAIDGSQRSAEHRARDKYRRPAETLSFFGITPTMNVVEIWPAGGWYAEILGPYLKPSGHLTEALLPAGSENADKSNAAFHARFDADRASFGTIAYSGLGPKGGPVAPDGSADLIVTFRNLHNWVSGGYADAALAGFYKALKPGGRLGVEDHRANPDKPQDPKAENGYVRQDYAIALAEKAGFKLVGASEIQANPRDTKDYPQGVWTLPPTFAEKDKDRAKYATIGEADNFVLLFEKPR